MPLLPAQALTLAQIPGWAISLLAIGFLVVCLALVLIVLIQRPQGGGLSGAFGAGGGAGQTAFGTKTGDVLTLVTIGIFVLFLLTAIGLNFAVRPPKAPGGPAAVTTPEADEEQAVTDAVLDEITEDPDTESTPGTDGGDAADTEAPEPPVDPAPEPTGDPSDGTP
jgi:preprotein translocase subunit SecG